MVAQALGGLRELGFVLASFGPLGGYKRFILCILWEGTGFVSVNSCA